MILLLLAAILSLLMAGTVVPLRRADAAELSDAALVAACGVGDAAALGLLFDRMHQGVYRFLARYLGQRPADLDDLVQATFLEVMRAAGSFRGDSTVKSWVFGIAANLGRNHVRGEVRRRAMLGRAAEAPPGDAARPDEQAERRQALERLAERVPELPHELRAPFVLCVLEERPCAEVAEVLGIREGTLWRRLYEARKLLRDALEGQAP